MRYALLRDNLIFQYGDFDEAPPELSVNKGVWIPVVEENQVTPQEGETIQVDVLIESNRVRHVSTACPIPISELKYDKLQKINAAFEQEFLAGFTPSTGPLTGYTLQVRNLEDRTNWLTSKSEYQSAVTNGDGAVSGAIFRSQSNETIVVTFEEGLAALKAMVAWEQTKYANLWVLKDAVAAATTREEVLSIDEGANW